MARFLRLRKMLAVTDGNPNDGRDRSWLLQEMAMTPKQWKATAIVAAMACIQAPGGMTTKVTKWIP